MERWLEDYLEADPMLLGDPLLLIGRQVPTAYGKYIDLLGMDAEGSVHVLELKRDKTPREVIAQVLDYGQWVSELTRDDIIALARDYLGRPLEEAFAERFGIAPPDDLNDSAHLTVVASELDPSSERIVNYLRTFGVLINAVFFAHLQDDNRRYLARTWLASSGDEASGPPIKRGGETRELERRRLVYLLRGLTDRPVMERRPSVRIRLCRRRQMVHADAPSGARRCSGQRPSSGARVRRGRRDYRRSRSHV